MSKTTRLIQRTQFKPNYPYAEDQLLAKPKELLEDKPGKEILLLANEAIARGVLEAGVRLVALYPGTPSSEIGNI